VGGVCWCVDARWCMLRQVPADILQLYFACSKAGCGVLYVTYVLSTAGLYVIYCFMCYIDFMYYMFVF
jgi:hypothetical protein